MRDDFVVEGPQDLDMERALLALVLADSAALDRLGRLEDDDFADPMNAVVLGAMRDLRSEARPVNLVTMQAKVGGAVFADGTAVLDALRQFSFAGVPPDAHDLAAAIRDKSLRRQIAQLGSDTTSAAWNEADSCGAIIAARIAELDKLLDKCRSAGQVQWTMMEAGSDLSDHLLNPPNNARIDTNITDLDRTVLGKARGDDLTELFGHPLQRGTRPQIRQNLSMASTPAARFERRLCDARWGFYGHCQSAAPITTDTRPNLSA